MSETYLIDINEITWAEDELNKLIKDYRETLEKIKHGEDDDCKKLKYSISRKKLLLEDKLMKIVENNSNNL